MDSTAHDTAIRDAPATTAVPAEYTWIQPRKRGLVRTRVTPSTSCWAALRRARALLSDSASALVTVLVWLLISCCLVLR